MGLWQWLKAEFVDAFTSDPKERSARKKQEAQDAMARTGWIQQCRDCHQTFATRKTVCPICECATDPNAPRKVILNKVYGGRFPSQAQKKEADILATCGWYAVSQAAGGVNAYKSDFRSRDAGRITVTYRRD